MKLINTDGMVFIGPGSEWFWTALTGVVLAVTFLGIYRQLALARSASAREQLASFNQGWSSERMMRHRLEIFVALRDGTDPAHLPGASLPVVASFWEEIGSLARQGHLDAKLMWDAGTGSDCPAWWLMLGPDIRRRRAEGAGPTLFENFEWLAGLMAERNRRAGATLDADEAGLAAGLGPRIATLRDALHVEEALRTVIVASPEAGAAATPPTALDPAPAAL